jgi:hypothetical protein
MRNLISFNESKETLQGFFFDKLDWNFLEEFLSYATDLEDSGNKVSIRCVVSGSIGKSFKHSKYIVIWSYSTQEDHLVNDIRQEGEFNPHIDEISLLNWTKKSYNDFGLYYLIYTEPKNRKEYHEGDLASRKKEEKYILDILNKLKSKYKIQHLPKITGEELIKVKPLI